MKASLKIRKTRTGNFDIFAELYLNDKERPRKKIATTPPEHWNPLTGEPTKSHPQYNLLFPLIKEFQSRMALINFGSYSYAEAKKILFAGDVDHQGNFLDFFTTFIKEKAIHGHNVTIHQFVLEQLKQFAGEYIPFDSINYEWLQKFIIYKKSSGTGTAGVNTYLRAIKTVYREAQRRTSLGVPPGNPFEGLIKNVAPKPRAVITPEHIQGLCEFTPTPGTTDANVQKMQRNLSIWVLQIIVGGHDYADIARLTWSNLQGDRIIFKRYKNRNKNYGGQEINNLLLPEAKKIIEQYGTPDEKRIFSFIPDPSGFSKYKQYCRGVARSLESLAKAAAAPHITLKSPRFIFRTMAGELLIHDLLVARIMGHKLEGVTYRYQGAIPKHLQDEAHINIVRAIFQNKKTPEGG